MTENVHVITDLPKVRFWRKPNFDQKVSVAIIATCAAVIVVTNRTVLVEALKTKNVKA